MPTTLLIDLDGVLLHREMYFSERLARDYGIDINLINEFFKKDFHSCAVGKTDIRNTLIPYLERWGWKEGIDALLEFWYATDGIVNVAMLSEIDALREEGMQCYFATDNERHRLKYILDVMGLGTHIDGVFGSSEMHVTKSQKEFWELVIAQLKVSPEELFFIDDDEKNVELAKSFGIRAVVYEKSIPTLRHALSME